MSKKTLVTLFFSAWVASIVMTWNVARLSQPLRSEESQGTSKASKSDHSLLGNDGKAERRMHPPKADGSNSTTPETAARRLEKIGSISNITERTVMAGKVIYDLCKAGYLEEAWDLIEQSPGQIRDSQLQTFFICAQKSLGQTEMLRRIEVLGSSGYAGDGRRALDGLIEGTGTGDLAALFENKEFQSVFDHLKSQQNGWQASNMITSHFKERMGNGEDVLDLAQIAFSHGVIGASNLMEILHTDKNLNAFDKFDIANRLVEKPSVNDMWRSELVKQLVGQDPARAMDLFMNDTTSSAISDLKDGLKYLSYKDPVMAGQWFEKNRSLMSDQKIDAAASAFCQSAIESGSEEVALQWVNQIHDSQIKDDYTKKIKSSFNAAEVGNK